MEHRRERMKEFKQMQDKHIGAIILREMEIKKKKRRRELAEAVEFLFLEDINKFTLRIKNPEISHVKLSDQISYSLGWDLGNAIKDGEVAKYSYDLKGGVSHIWYFFLCLNITLFLSMVVSMQMAVSLRMSYSEIG
jgi:hypothetical protein